MITDRVVSGGPVILGADVSPVPIGYRQLADLSAATSIPNLPDGACRAIIAASGATIRWRDDWEDPTSTEGMPAVAGDAFTYEGPVSGLRFLGPGVTLDVALYR